MQLKDVSIYKEHNLYYMKLIYNYTDDKGNEHCRVFPKVCFPTELCNIPPISNVVCVPSGCLCRPSSLESSYFFEPNINRIYIERDMVNTPEGGLDDVAFADWITEYATQDMTLEEIENKLGYKVKIVSEKEKSTGNKVKK